MTAGVHAHVNVMTYVFWRSSVLGRPLTDEIARLNTARFFPVVRTEVTGLLLAHQTGCQRVRGGAVRRFMRRDSVPELYSINNLKCASSDIFLLPNACQIAICLQPSYI